MYAVGSIQLSDVLFLRLSGVVKYKKRSFKCMEDDAKEILWPNRMDCLFAEVAIAWFFLMSFPKDFMDLSLIFYLSSIFLSCFFIWN